MSKKDEIMDILAKNESTQRELWQALKISRSYLSELLKDLEKDGLISRKKVSERTVIVSINRSKIIRVGVLKASEYAAVYLTAHDLTDLHIELLLYNNGLEELTALETGKIDIAFAPIVSGFMLHIVDEHLVITSACARGGSGIVYHKQSGDIGSTMFSTMDLKSRIYSGYHVEKIKYFDSPEEMISNFKNNKINALAIWEPYYSMLKGKNKKILESNKICCGALVLRDSIDEHIKLFLNKFKENSLLLKDGKRWAEAAKLMQQKLKINIKIILKSLKSYNFDTLISEKDIRDAIANFGIKVPEKKYNDFICKISD
ncbi:MAG: ArsR family transcriptional regulator [Thermoplasmata archaeon]